MNDVKKKHPGQPRKFQTPESMQIAIDKYFNENEHYTMCGLALALGFMDRQSIYDYAGYEQEYSCLIKNARLRVENGYENDLRNAKNPTGSIFALKQMKWTDKQDHDIRINNLTDLLSEIDGKNKGLPNDREGS